MLHILRPINYSHSISIGLFLLRFVVGLAFFYHGSVKIQNPFGWMGPEAQIPSFFQGLAALAEFGGGIGLLLGFLTPLASLGIACTMLVAVGMHIFVFHDPFISATGGSYELASVYLVVAIFFLLAGPGAFSLDRLFFGKRN